MVRRFMSMVISSAYRNYVNEQNYIYKSTRSVLATEAYEGQ
jgi:hypothetical protein